MAKWLEARRPPATADLGRNDPCPCGPGRKFKQCCLRNPKPASGGGDTIGTLLTHKLLSIDGARSPRATLVGLASSATLAPVDDDGDFDVDTLIAFAQDPFIADLALHEAGLAEDFHGRWAAALPEPERRVLEDWIDAPRRLWEITDLDPGASIELRDTATADRLTVTERLASTALEVGDLLLATVVPVGAELQVLGTPLPVPLQARESVLELIDARATADEWAEWYGWLVAPPTMVTREGHPLVICRAELRAPLDPDRVEATLDDRLGQPDAGRWHDTIDIEGETAIRSTIAIEVVKRLHAIARAIPIDVEELFWRIEPAIAVRIGVPLCVVALAVAVDVAPGFCEPKR